MSGHASGNPDVGAGFEGNIGYSFVVVGPHPDVFVPVFASYALHASAIGALANASAGFQVWFTSAGDFSSSVDADSAHATPADIFDTLGFTMISRHIGQVSLGASGTSFGGMVEAFADPYLFIDPAFLASNPGYEVVSAGVGNVAPR